MRPELERLVLATLEGDDRSSWVLKHLLDYCVELQARSPEEWEGQQHERAWADPSVRMEMPEFSYFLPTPAELEEVKRRFRLALVQDGRLNRLVLQTLDRAADRSVLVPLAYALETYDGDPSRYGEIDSAMSLLYVIVGEAPDDDRCRAKHAIEHVHEVGAGAVEAGFSLSDRANEVLAAGFGDQEASRRHEAKHPLPQEWERQQSEQWSTLAERFSAMTAEVVLTVDKADWEVARHLYLWTREEDGTGSGLPLLPVSGSAAQDKEDFVPCLSLCSGLWVSRLRPESLGEFFAEIVEARWQKPELVQLLVKDDEPYFVLHMLREGELLRCGP